MTGIRRFIHVVFVLGIAAAAVFHLPFGGCSYLKIGYIRLVCPVGFAEVVLASKSIPYALLPGAVVLAFLVTLLGRAYCSWVCPASLVGDETRRLSLRVLPKKLTGTIRGRWKRLKQRTRKRWGMERGDTLALIAGLAIGTAVFGYPAFSLVCPVGVVSRNIIELAVHGRVRGDLVFLVIPLLFGLFYKTGWKCFCPVGVVRGVLAGKNKTFGPAVDRDTCTSCGRCRRACPAGIDMGHEVPDPALCSKCLACVDACPVKAVSVHVCRRVSGEDDIA